MLEVGTDGNDTIEYTEFIAAAMDKKKIIKEDVVWEAFKIFDQDGNGQVTKKELLKILTGRTSDKIRQVHGNKAIENFLDNYDKSGDDVIDFDEFMGMLAEASRSFHPTQGTRRPVAHSIGGIGFANWCCSPPALCSCSTMIKASPECTAMLRTNPLT